MSIDTLGYVKRLEAAGVTRAQAEAHAEALRGEVVPQLATSADLSHLGDKLDAKIDTVANRFEALLWKHSVAIILAVLAVGGFLIRFGH